MGEAFEERITDLRYGIIGINVWSGWGFTIPYVSWGAYPGNTLDQVGSGIGVMHNARLVAGVERTVLRGPFRPFPRSLARGEFALSPKPPWFVTSRTSRSTAVALTGFSARPSWWRLPGLVIRAMFG